MRVLVVTQKGWDGPTRNAVRIKVPLRRADMVEEAVSIAKTLASNGELVAIKVATAPDARLCRSGFSGKEIVSYVPGHEMTDWRSVVASFPAIGHCGICGRRLKWKYYECRQHMCCEVHGFFCNAIPR